MEQLNQSLQFFFSLPQEQLAQMAACFVPEQLSKGTSFLRAGQYAQKLSYVASGYLRIWEQHEKAEVTQWISGPGYFVTDLRSLIFQEGGRWQIDALCDCELMTLSGEQYRQLADRIPAWDRIEKRFLAKCFALLEDRVHEFLSLSARQRYDRLFARDPELFNQVPLQYIASMLGMSPETLSRIRREVIS